MSYDVMLFELAPGQSTDEYFEGLERREEAEAAGSAQAHPAASALAEHRRLATLLSAADPNLESYESERGSIQLDGPEIQVFFGDDGVTINVPYWDSLDPSRVAERIGVVATTLSREAGFLAFDLQLGRVVSFPADASEVAEAFSRGAGTLREVVAEQESGRKRRRWPFGR